MRILYLSAYFYPEVTSSSYLSDNRNQAFADKGFEMVVYTPSPTRGVSNQIRHQYKQKKVEKMYNGRMTVHRFGLMAEGKNPIMRALRYTLSCLKHFNRGVFAKDARKCDVMFISSTPPIQGVMAALIKKIRHIPIVYNLQDVFPDSLVGSGLTSKGSILWKIGRCLEDFTYRNVDKIIVISEDFRRNLLEKGVPEDKIEVVYNWVDETAIVPIPKEKNILYDELNLSRDKFYVVYAGNFGNAQNIQVILRAAELLKSYSDICFVLFGTGGLKEEFEKQATDMALSNVRFFPLQPYERVSYVYSLGDVGIVSCKKGIGKGAMPSKTWSILSTATPVLASYDSDTDIERLITENNIGLFAESDDYEAFAQAVVQLYNDRDLCEEMGKNGRMYIERNLTKKVGTSTIVKIIDSLIQN